MAIAAVTVGMVSSLGWILLSADTFERVYGMSASDALVPSRERRPARQAARGGGQAS
jgi:hypothetical protein